MNLYELNEEIKNFEFEFDEETGEITNLSDLDNLKLMKDEKIENLALYINEINKLQKRLKAKETKVKGLKSYLEYIKKKKKFESAKVDIRYRKTTSLNIDNDNLFIEYAKDHGLNNLFTVDYKEKPNKTEIKKYLKENELPYCSIVEGKNMSIK